MANRHPTAEEVSEGFDLTGKLALITGANTGIGKETARVLALRNAHVIMACRSVEKGLCARSEIIAELGEDKAPQLEVMEVDLSSLSSVRRFGERFKERFEGKRSLDLLILNAGLSFPKARVSTEDGFEAQFGTNHLGHFYLTRQLLPLLSSNPGDPPARVVVVSSQIHRYLPKEYDEQLLRLEDPRELFKEDYGAPNMPYALSKLCNIMFSFELNRRLAAEGKNVISTSVHPGMVRTALARELPEEEYDAILASYAQITGLPLDTVAQGAAPAIFAALSSSSPEALKGGGYFEDGAFVPPREGAHDPQATRALWILSERAIAEFESVLLLPSV